MTKEMNEYELTSLIKQLNLDQIEVDCSSKQDGWIQVNDQTIIVHDPVGDGEYPVISAVPPVRLKINDRYVESECAVSSTDHIHWEIEEKALFEIFVSKDKLYAYFHLITTKRFAWRLIDTEPMQQIAIMAEENKDIVLETVQINDVIKQLEQMSIQSNLDITSLQLELESPTYKPIVIAKGKAATPGKDAQLEIYFSEQVKNRYLEVSGLIDYRNHLHIPTVKSGDVIAKKIPLVDGVPGYDVYGNVIVPTQPKDIMIVTKPSVEMTSAGEIIALKDGRPRIMGGKIKTFDISTSYIVPGDVDIQTGNIVFSGDVIVYGNVADNMIIESLGNVYVYGSVYNATVTATGSVYINSHVIGSKLYSGYFGVMFNRLYCASKILSEHIEKLLAAATILIKALQSRNQKIRFGQIVTLLMENKFKDLPATMKELLFVVSNIQHIKKEEYQKLQKMTEVFLQPTNLLEIASYSFIQSYLTLLQETHQEVARMQEEITEIQLSQCHNSVIKSNGDIKIQRDGVVLSDLYAARNINFQYENAVCRGSQLEAGDSINAKIVGSQTGANTLLKAKRQVRVKKMLSGQICVGKYCTEIVEVVEDVKFNFYNMKQYAYPTYSEQKQIKGIAAEKSALYPPTLHAMLSKRG